MEKGNSEVDPRLVSLASDLAKGSANSDEEMAALHGRLMALRVPEIRCVAKYLGVRLTGASRKIELCQRILAMAPIDADAERRGRERCAICKSIGLSVRGGLRCAQIALNFQ